MRGVRLREALDDGVLELLVEAVDGIEALWLGDWDSLGLCDWLPVRFWQASAAETSSAVGCQWGVERASAPGSLSLPGSGSSIARVSLPGWQTVWRCWWASGWLIWSERHCESAFDWRCGSASGCCSESQVTSAMKLASDLEFACVLRSVIANLSVPGSWTAFDWRTHSRLASAYSSMMELA